MSGTPDPFQRITRNRMNAAMARGASLAPHFAPALRSLAAREIALVLIERGALADDLSLSALDRQALPILVGIQDDDHAASGPTRFPAGRKVLRWTRGVVLNAAAGDAAHYGAAVAAARALGSLVLIETGTDHALAWRDAAIRAALPRTVPLTMILPREGVHPLAPVTH